MYQFKSKTLTCTVCASEQFLSATHHGATVQKAPSASDHFLSKTNVQFTLSGRVLTTLAEMEALTILTKSKANFPQIFLLFFPLLDIIKGQPKSPPSNFSKHSTTPPQSLFRGMLLVSSLQAGSSE